MPMWYPYQVPSVITNDRSWRDWLDIKSPTLRRRQWFLRGRSATATKIARHLITKSHSYSRQKKLWVESYWPGCHCGPTPGRDPTTARHGDFWLLGVPLWPGSPLPSQPGHPGFLQDAHIDGELSADTQSTWVPHQQEPPLSDPPS